ncbi:MAG: hypothetical protein Q7S55_01175 [Nanoarchaeota archaeon]|nr:hypothetical protein [Nanoarchaeota archaeon]
MRPNDFLMYLDTDSLYLEAFCHKYQSQVIDIFPNTEDFPPQGLTYVFDNQLGGFSIEGIKNSLESSLEEKISEGD